MWNWWKLHVFFNSGNCTNPKQDFSVTEVLFYPFLVSAWWCIVLLYLLYCFSSTRPQLHRLQMGPHVYLDSRRIGWFWKCTGGSWGLKQGWAKVRAIQRAVSLNTVECARLRNLLRSISNLLLCSVCRLCQPHKLPLFFSNEGSRMTTEYFGRKHRSLYCKTAQCWLTIKNDATLQIWRLCLTLAALSNVDLWLSLKWLPAG